MSGKPFCKMKNKKNNQSISQKADQLIRNYQVSVSSGKEEVLDSLLTKIDKKEYAESKPERKISRYMAVAVSVAATVAILLAFWFYFATETISAGKGQTFACRLPDNSRVILHNESSATFRKYFWNGNVKLLGEAYFEVEKGDGFRVKTSQGEVEVLGTRFLVDGWDEQFKVQCFQGSVKTSFGNTSYTLEPGTQFTGKEEEAQKNTFKNEAGYPGFAQFQKNFSNTPLNEVVYEIGTFFGVDITLQVPSGKNFSGTLQTGSLENALKIVCVPLQLDYVFEDKYRITIN